MGVVTRCFTHVRWQTRRGSTEPHTVGSAAACTRHHHPWPSVAILAQDLARAEVADPAAGWESWPRPGCSASAGPAERAFFHICKFLFIHNIRFQMQCTALPTVLEDTVFEGFPENVSFEEGSIDEEDDEGLQRERWTSLLWTTLRDGQRECLRTASSDDVAVDLITEDWSDEDGFFFEPKAPVSALRWHLLSAGAKVLWEIQERAGTLFDTSVENARSILRSVRRQMCGQARLLGDFSAQGQDAGANG